MNTSYLKVTAVCMALSMSMQVAAVTYIDCDFRGGIPEDFTNLDRDGRDLHFTMTQLGFSAKDAWTTLREEGTENYYAASASRFKTSKGEEAPMADDWLITPAVWVRAADAKLSWRGMSVNDRNSRTSSYEVMISVTGTDPEDFVSLPEGNIPTEEIYKWTTHEISLADYCGKRVYIAFVNKSVDSDILALDDINVSGGSGLADLRILPGEYCIGAEEIRFGGVLTATSDETVNSLSVTFSVGDDTFKAEYSDLHLENGQQFEFTIPDKVAANYGDRLDFSVASTVNDVAFDEQNLHTTLLAFLPVKRIVVEEATGMWCGYCPEGTVAMETLQQRYPDSFIGVAVHVNDALQVDGYGDMMDFPGGAPTAWIDRKTYVKEMLTPVFVDEKHTYTTLMGGIETLFLDRMREQTFADVDVTGELSDGADELKAEVSIRFAKGYADADFRLVLLLTEDHVWRNGYYQTNYHSGRDEILNGFETLPPRIFEDYEFNHVARSVMGNHTGIEGIIPSDVTAGETYGFSSTFYLPITILNPANIKLIAMIADASTGEILNSNQWTPESTGISCLPDGKPHIIVEGNHITATGEGDLEVEVFDLSGICHGHAKGSRHVTISNLPQGISLVTVTTGNSKHSYKVAIH